MTKLLLVEDDNNLREIYEARLQAEGYTIVSAHDGEEALVVAKAEKPDLIISDVMMPKISGFEMLDILRNTDGLRDVKVIMLTALGQSDDQQRADRLGADRYLVKSQVTLEDIVKVAHDLLNENGGDTTSSETAPETTSPPPELPDNAPAAPENVEPVQAPVPAEPAAPEPGLTSDDSASTPADPAPVADPASTSSTDPTASPAEPPTAPEPVAVTESATSSTAIPVSDATSSASEEAAVEAQIEDFVAGASSESPQPVAEPATDTSEPMATPPPVEPETTTEPSEVIEPSLDEAATKAADEKLVSDAAEALEASTKETEKPDEEESEVPQQKKVGGERVIEPIESEPKKDITDLLAIEEAKEAGTPSPATPPAPTDKVDPNNIAL